MLRSCEFNGRKDVLYFKMLQAAIHENNAKKISAKNLNQNVQKPTENSVLENNYSDENREIEPYQKRFRANSDRCDDSDDGQCQFRGYRDRDVYADERKKKKISSSMSSLDARPKRKYENPFMAKSRPAIRLKRTLPVSESKKSLKNSHGLHRSAIKVKKTSK